MSKQSAKTKCCPRAPLTILTPGHMQALAEVTCVRGTAQPCAVVKVRVDNLPLQTVTACANGCWCIQLDCPLRPGCHAVYAVSNQGQDNAAYACFIILKRLELQPCPCAFPKPVNADGPIALSAGEPEVLSANEPALPPAPGFLQSPTFTYPLSGQVIDEALPVITGKASAGNMVIACIRGLMCTRTFADGEGNFSAVFARELPSGTYTLTALQSDASGNRSEFAEHSFTVERG